ncbi:MAG: hypothetical protein ACRD3A_05615 [Terriglobales bacterium]
MRILRIACVAALLLGVAGWAFYQSAPPPARPLAEIVPAGPLLYLEAKDFSAIVRDWNASPEKEVWLKSDNFAVFARSHLLLRLTDARDEFAAAAGFPPDMSLVEQVAGGESALALYDIGKLEFLYVTRLPSARAVENALWRARADYQPRSAAGSQYFVRVDPASRRTVAFAVSSDYLLLATREDLVAGALTLLAGQPGAAVASERWFDQSLRAAGPAGDLRLVMDLDALIRTPHFRSYWIQRNVSDLRQYASAVSDLHRYAGEYREERVFLRAQASAAADSEVGAPSRESEEAAVGALLPFVPDSCGLYRAWAAPKVDDALALLERKILLPRTGAPPASKEAPGVYLSGGIVGSEADLETRIDEPPLPDVRGGVASEPLRKLFQDARLSALLQLQSTREIGGFVATPSALVFQSSSDWNPEAVRSALVPAVETLWSTSRLGLRWVERKQGAVSYAELDGLAHLAVGVRGRFLVIAENSDAVASLLGRASGTPSSKGASYAAGFCHASERDNLARMVRWMEFPSRPAESLGESSGSRQPAFFSQNLTSLSATLGRVESSSILVRDSGPTVSQTVIYKWKQ